MRPSAVVVVAGWQLLWWLAEVCSGQWLGVAAATTLATGATVVAAGVAAAVFAVGAAGWCCCCYRWRVCLLLQQLLLLATGCCGWLLALACCRWLRQLLAGAVAAFCLILWLLRLAHPAWVSFHFAVSESSVGVSESRQ